MKKPPTLILVADSCQARLISHSPKGNDLLWKAASRAARKPTEKLVSDRPGLSFSSAGPGRRAMVPHTSAHRSAQLKFARRVAKALAKSVKESAFGKFILIAPPRALGDLRRELADDVKSRVTGELRKDLADMPDTEVVAHVRDSALFL